MIYTLRFDSTPIDVAASALIGSARVYRAVPAREGVLHYPELGRRELYVPRNDAGLKTLEGAPVVVGHPASGVLDALAHAVAPGRIANVRLDGAEVRAEVRVSALWLIDEIESGALRELSVGYDVKLDATPGTWRGERYDAVQIERRVDHVGLFPRGASRCGAQCSIRSDQREERETMINNGCYCSGETMCKPCAEIHAQVTGGGAPRADADPAMVQFLTQHNDGIGWPHDPNQSDVVSTMKRMEAGLEPDGAK